MAERLSRNWKSFFMLNGHTQNKKSLNDYQCIVTDIIIKIPNSIQFNSIQYMMFQCFFSLLGEWGQGPSGGENRVVKEQKGEMYKCKNH